LLLQGTLVLDDAVLTDRRAGVRSLVDQLRAWHQRTFGLLVSMDHDQISIAPMEGDFGKRHLVAMTLEKAGAFDPPDPVLPGKDAPHDSLEWLASDGPRELIEQPPLVVSIANAAYADVEKAIKANESLLESLHATLAARSIQRTDLMTFLESIKVARPFVTAVPLGRVGVLPSLLSMLLERTNKAMARAEANVRSAEAVLTGRIGELRRALKESRR